MDDSTRLRTAEAADYDRIIAVVDDWWGRPVRQALPRLFLDHFHATSFIAEHDGDLAGFLIGFLSPSLPDAAYIQFVGVDPRLRGTGLARLLYERFFDLAAADGRHVVRAVTAPLNSRSRSTPPWASPPPPPSPTTTARPLPRSSSNAA